MNENSTADVFFRNAKSEMVFSDHSGLHSLIVQQFLPVSLEKAWKFFSNPENLAIITPEKMQFKITSGKPGKMYAGQIITYKVGIVPFIKNNWVTEITHVNEMSYFIDEQRIGPYRMWHHEHHFFKHDQGVLMVDRVTYKIPFGFIGRLTNKIYIKKRLKGIFSYRIQKLNDIFEIPHI